MMKRAAGVVFLLTWLVSAPAVSAFNTRITVYASVPEMRAVYVNKAGYITKVAGNTPNNIQPRVYDENNQIIAMTDTINQQYQQFLQSHGGKLQASKIYEINPVSVSNLPNTQSVQVNGSQTHLALSL